MRAPSERGSAIVLALGLLTLVAFLFATRAAVVARALDIARSRRLGVTEIIRAFDESASSVEALQRAGALADLTRSGATSSNSIGIPEIATPQIIKVGGRTPAFLVSWREGSDGVLQPDWTVFADFASSIECSAESTSPGTIGSSRHDCTSDARIRANALVRGNLVPVDGLELSSSADPIVVAVRGDVRGALKVCAPEILLVATGNIALSTITACGESRISLVSSSGTVEVGRTPALNLCSPHEGAIFRLGIQSARGSALSGHRFPPGVLGCPIPRSAPFWQRIKLVGEQW